MVEKNNANDEQEGGKTRHMRAFKFADALENCDEAIEKYMCEPNGVYYRLVHNPLHPNDELPQPLQKWDALTTEEVALPTKISEGSSIDDKWAQTRNYSPSYNMSDEKLAAYFLGILDKRRTDRQKQKLLDKKR